jgi:hypothetical protein
MLASDLRSTRLTHASTTSRVGTKPIQSSACNPATPMGAPRGVDHCRDCIQPSSASTGAATNRTNRIGASHAHGNQPRAGSGEYRATADMARSGTAGPGAVTRRPTHGCIDRHRRQSRCDESRDSWSEPVDSSADGMPRCRQSAGEQ